MRFFQLLLKVANHAALLAPTVKQTLDQQEKVGSSGQTKKGGLKLIYKIIFFELIVVILNTNIALQLTLIHRVSLILFSSD